jgi:hypothetical protein
MSNSLPDFYIPVNKKDLPLACESLITYIRQSRETFKEEQFEKLFDHLASHWRFQPRYFIKGTEFRVPSFLNGLSFVECKQDDLTFGYVKSFWGKSEEEVYKEFPYDDKDIVLYEFYFRSSLNHIINLADRYMSVSYDLAKTLLDAAKVEDGNEVVYLDRDSFERISQFLVDNHKNVT